MDNTYTRERYSKNDRKILRSRVIEIAWPAVTELVLVSLFGAIDMMMAGQIGSIGTTAITAIGLTNQPIFLAMAVFQALNIGGTALVSRFIGAKKESEANNTTMQLLYITFFLSFFVVIPAVMLAKQIYIFMGADKEVIDIGLMYFKIVLYGIFPQNFALAIAAVLRGAGDTKTPMMINIFSNLLNVFGNYVLIFGHFGFPELGVTGAGVSTLISRIISMVMLGWILFNGKSKIKLNFKNKYKVDLTTIKRLMRIGFPSALEQFFLRTGNLFFVRVVATLGTVIYAAHQVSLSILSMSFTSGMAFGMAASTLIGQSLGAEDKELAEEYGKEVRFLGSIVATAIGVIFFIFGPQIVALYSNDPEVIKRASFVLKMIAIIQPFQSSQLIYAGGLRGAGDTRWPLISTLAGIWFVRVTLAYLFINGLGYGLIGAWLAICIDQIIRYFILLWRFRLGKWKHITV